MKNINSEINLSNDTLKIKIGTMNKKTPNNIYICLGAYIMPTIVKDNYNNTINNINTTAKKFVKNNFINPTRFQDNFILLTSVAEGRMALNKKSYFEMEIYLKPTLNLFKKGDRTFQGICDTIQKDMMDELIDFIVTQSKNEGFMISKTLK